MKKFLSLVLILALMCTLCACGGGDTESKVSPMEKLTSYIEENGEKDGERTVVDYPDGASIINSSEKSLSKATSSANASTSQECLIVKNGDKIQIEITDRNVTSSGLKMERTVVLSLDGTFAYYNGMVMDGQNFGVNLEGEIPAKTYTKKDMPVITKADFPSGAKMNDEVKETSKEYIDLTLDCLSSFLAQESLNLTLADVGFEAYAPAAATE